MFISLQKNLKWEDEKRKRTHRLWIGMSTDVIIVLSTWFPLSSRYLEIWPEIIKICWRIHTNCTKNAGCMPGGESHWNLNNALEKGRMTQNFMTQNLKKNYSAPGQSWLVIYWSAGGLGGWPGWPLTINFLVRAGFFSKVNYGWMYRDSTWYPFSSQRKGCHRV